MNGQKNQMVRRAVKISSLLVLPLTPIAQALAQEMSDAVAGTQDHTATSHSAKLLCQAPTAPWQCEQINGQWSCQGSAAFSVDDHATQDEAGWTAIQANSVKSTDGQQYELSGDVRLQRDRQSLRAPSISFNRQAQSAKASGGARLEDQGLIAYADRIESNATDELTKLWDVRYALKTGTGNGKAREIEKRGDTSVLRGVTFTSCPGDTPAWQVRARRIELNQESEIGQAKDFKIYVGNWPVFYLPFASFPLTDKRKSGLLAPVFLGSNDGLDISFPYYLNLAPNYDATLTPRVIQQRGFSLGTEFRHLGTQSSTELLASYLPHDRKRDDNRYTFNLVHQYAFTPNWRFATNLNEVSDDFYFQDLGDSLTTAATSILPSEAGIYGRGLGWDAGLSADRYEIIDPANPNSQDPYRRAPRLFFNSNQQLGAFNYGVQSELAKFRRDDSPEGSRFDVSPFVRYEFSSAFAFIRPELRWRYTRYRLEDGVAANNLRRRASRSLPIASVDMGLYFDRDNAFGNPDYRQTLEPRLYYLYSPFRDQSQLPVFDTTELDFSFPQLFRTNRFSGPDRQADANQVAVALTSRLIDLGAGIEKFRFSLGQIRYFDDSLVTLPDVAPFTSSAGVWVAEAGASLGQNWRVNVAQQYDPEVSRTRLSAIRLQRTLGDTGLINFGYRYRSNRIEQVDLSGVVPIDERWSLIGRFNYSLPESRTLEALAGFQYESCCWRLRMLGRHYLRAGTLDGRNTLFFELELKGLGVLGRKTDRVLERAIVGFSGLGLDQ